MGNLLPKECSYTNNLAKFDMKRKRKKNSKEQESNKSSKEDKILIIIMQETTYLIQYLEVLLF